MGWEGPEIYKKKEKIKLCNIQVEKRIERHCHKRHQRHTKKPNMRGTSYCNATTVICDKRNKATNVVCNKHNKATKVICDKNVICDKSHMRQTSYATNIICNKHKQYQEIQEMFYEETFITAQRINPWNLEYILYYNKLHTVKIYLVTMAMWKSMSSVNI